MDHLSDVDMVHMPAEMSMETALSIDFQEAWAEGQRCVTERVVAAVEADNQVVLDRAFKWKYGADMEAARREAPAGIEWPELDGHHGILVLNVPLGSLGYVHAYMRGKVEELLEEMDASLSKLLFAKPSRR
eukprot:jgi/Tetstr1/442378/TSEL_030504.t1